MYNLLSNDRYIITLCMLAIFLCFCCHLLTFFKINLDDPDLIVCSFMENSIGLCFQSLHPSQQFFSHVGRGPPGLN